MKYLATLSALCLGVAALNAAQAPKQKSNQNPPTKGTTQMAGQNAKLNTAYTLGKTDPINITLTAVRYIVSREIIGQGVLAPSKDEKLLVIDFVAHNPNPKTISFSGAMVKFTGVDQESVNRVNNGTFTRAKTGEVFYAELKPAQKVELRTVIVVPANGTVPKLILEHRSGGDVLRYDIKSSLLPIPIIFADPKDETGMTVADTWNCPADTYFPMPQIDIKYVPGTVVQHGKRFGPNTVGDGKTFSSAKFMLKGQSPSPAFLRFDAEFIDENGEKYPVTKLAQVSTEDHVSRRLELGEEYAVRFVAVTPDNVKLKTLKVIDTSMGKSRTYVFPL